MSTLAAPTVLVTGAAKRIGRVIAIELSRRGFSVAIHYGNSRVEAEAVSRECCGAPLFQADMTKVDDIRRLFQDVQTQVGPLNCLVNNAARFTRIEPLDVTEADWDFIHDVNLKATFFCCQEGARQMKQVGSGRIVNISSLGGIRPWAEHAHYCASKAGVIMLTKALSKAFAPQITVNSVAPGVIPFNDVDARVQAMIDATPHAPGRDTRRDSRCGALFSDCAHVYYRSDLSCRWRIEPSLGRFARVPQNLWHTPYT